LLSHSEFTDNYTIVCAAQKLEYFEKAKGFLFQIYEIETE
jgi:hypothetical protein